MVEMSRRDGVPVEFNGKQHICTYRSTVLVLPLSQYTTSIRFCQCPCCITREPQTNVTKTFHAGQTSPLIPSLVLHHLTGILLYQCTTLFVSFLL